MDEILEVLEKDARISPQELARLLRRQPEQVKKAVKGFEKQGIIVGYKTIINRELLQDNNNFVSALIEVRVTPQKDVGFDKIAERIYSFPEVKSCYLLSGTYDLLILIEGRSIHTVSDFVAEKLASLEHVRRTTTHFLLKRYKEDGVILKRKRENKRIAISY
ncbi:MAG: Lrp/AsnC family transcriptional regulator [Candidatus Omnitrophica bacterium]|nr:Lrp/AsnC family transcriptional regulator [Candidatus Omnitrophota bacterium]